MKLMLYMIYLDTVLVTMTKATFYKRVGVCVWRDYRFKRLESMTVVMAGSVAASGMVLELRLTS